MGVLWPCGYKATPTIYPFASPAFIIQQPVMSLHFPFGCDTQSAVLQLDRMPLMNREPETIPDVPGSYTGVLEYLDMGVAPADEVGATWIGWGAQSWDVYVDGVVMGNIDAYDGQVGPLGVALFNPGGNWGQAGPYSVYIQATYHDRPSFKDFYMSAGMGVIAFRPWTDPRCPSIGTVGWGQLGYWDPWVDIHHSVTDVQGPVDRYGNYLTLQGPWGSNVGQQALASSSGCDICHILGIPPGSAWASTLIDFVATEIYPEITYPIQTVPQSLDGCTVPTSTATPVFDTTRAHKLGGGA